MSQERLARLLDLGRCVHLRLIRWSSQASLAVFLLLSSTIINKLSRSLLSTTSIQIYLTQTNNIFKILKIYFWNNHSSHTWWIIPANRKCFFSLQFTLTDNKTPTPKIIIATGSGCQFNKVEQTSRIRDILVKEKLLNVCSAVTWIDYWDVQEVQAKCSNEANYYHMTSVSICLIYGDMKITEKWTSS